MSDKWNDEAEKLLPCRCSKLQHADVHTIDCAGGHRIAVAARLRKDGEEIDRLSERLHRATDNANYLGKESAALREQLAEAREILDHVRDETDYAAHGRIDAWLAANRELP